jgi:hypothetical protein
MGDAAIGAVVAVGILVAACVCICVAGTLSPSNTQIEVTYIRNPIPRIVVQPSVGSDEPEDYIGPPPTSCKGPQGIDPAGHHGQLRRVLVPLLGAP